jgi:hypothetical protein
VFICVHLWFRLELPEAYLQPGAVGVRKEGKAEPTIDEANMTTTARPALKRPVLGPTGKQWLKSLHLIVSVIWLGAAISMNVLRYAWTPAEPGDLYAVDHAIAVIDNWVVVPAAWGSLLTGLFESWLTSWGFFKYRWVTLKWILTVAIMIYAPLFIAQWDRNIEAISRVEGLLALQNPAYLEYRLLYTLSGVVLIAALAGMSLISTLKPWTKADRLRARPPAGR